MNKFPIASILAIYLILILPNFLTAGPDSTQTVLYRIELTDGSVLMGTIISEDETSIQFRTVSELDVTIQKDRIAKRDISSAKVVEGKVWRSDPNRTRLFFAPTGRALKAGQGYFSVYEIFFPFIAVGVTDFLALAGGLSLFPGSSEQLFYLAPKITPIQLGKFDLSGGVLYIFIPNEEDNAGIFYGVGTYGNQSASLTVGIGFGFSGGDVADKPVFAVGAELRSSNSVAFITENWFIPDSEYQIVSFGLRFFGENLAADFGLIHPAGADTEGFPFFPWIGFAFNFGATH
ncbi:MAG: hypothetical protein JSW33_15615 [bacterium]|nr:MAG: hypothetical protein JSW33_15615 [bacterium]